MTIVDMRPPHLDGLGDPVATLVMGAGAADVETVIVGGQIVKAGGSLVASLAERARELMHASRSNLRDRTRQDLPAALRGQPGSPPRQMPAGARAGRAR